MNKKLNSRFTIHLNVNKKLNLKFPRNQIRKIKSSFKFCELIFIGSRNKMQQILFKMSTPFFYDTPQSVLHGVANNTQVCWLLIFVFY